MRLAPVPARSLKDGAIDFISQYLEADTAILEALPHSAFRRPPSNRNSAIKDEIIVCFKTSDDRDYIKSLAFWLAGKQSCSIRQELPRHLLG